MIEPVYDAFSVMDLVKEKITSETDKGTKLNVYRDKDIYNKPEQAHLLYTCKLLVDTVFKRVTTLL